ncbi:MAG: prolyl oligopeptidase family serine peptidase [Phycisphaeraceae bacterium]|nr:MAG: prolyl oligopeptidase family serine peptidase [Phycisphaeraceae bacterium]
MTQQLWLALIGVLTMAFAGSAAAGDAPPEGFIYKSIDVGGHTYPFVVYRPRGLDATKPARGLIFLHGSGECGTDGSKMLGVGLPNALLWDPDRWPFVILIPQKPDSQCEWEDHDDAVMAMLDRMIKEQNVDPHRVAITGLSQGGHGTIALASRHPGRFRAAAPVCGYISPVWHDGKRGERTMPGGDDAKALVESFRTTPVWLFHGGKDDVVPPANSQWLHDQLNEVGLDCKITIFPDDNHNSWDSAYRKSGVWDWLVEMTE